MNANLINAGAHHYLFTQYMCIVRVVLMRAHYIIAERRDIISYQLKMHAEAPAL